MTVHPISQDDIQAFVDERLDADRRATVGAYLAAHADARAQVERVRRLNGDLRAALAPVTAEAVPARLDLARIVKAQRRMRVSPWQAAAAGVLLMVGGLGGWGLRATQTTMPTGVEALAQEASTNFAVYAPDRTRPVELAASNSNELARWFSARLNRTIDVPDLTGSNYRLMGGRLVATPHGPAALLMYDNDKGTRVAMLMRPMARPDDLPMHEHKSGSDTSYAWAQNGLGYSVVGSIDPAVLHPLADEVRRAVAKGNQAST